MNELFEYWMEKKADLLGGLVGGVRASRLSEKQEKDLKKEYGLKDDANLQLRNAGRGFLGSSGGALGGVALSALVAGLGAKGLKAIQKRRPRKLDRYGVENIFDQRKRKKKEFEESERILGPIVGGTLLTSVPAGYIVGADKSTEKYSRKRHEELRGKK